TNLFDRCIKPFLKIEFKKYCCTYVCTAIFLIQNQLAFYYKRNLSATIAINSEFVGFAFVILTVYPHKAEMESTFPRLHATSMACRIAPSPLEAVVSSFLAISGYNTLVIEPSSSIS